MKTKEKLLVLICLLFCISGATAQTYYYNETKTFSENGYVYQCDVRSSNVVKLYNKSNQWTYLYPVYKNTGEPFIVPDAGIDLFEDETSVIRTKRYAIVNNAFSTAEKQLITGHELFITMYISPDSGKVVEVNFEFGNFEPYATIPVSVYRNIEVALKKEVWYIPTEEGRKLNYIYFWWSQEPK